MGAAGLGAAPFAAAAAFAMAVGVDLGARRRRDPLVDLFGAAAPTPVVDLLGAGPRTVTVDLARERVAAVAVDLARAKSPEPPAVETPRRQVPVVPAATARGRGRRRAVRRGAPAQGSRRQAAAPRRETKGSRQGALDRETRAHAAARREEGRARRYRAATGRAKSRKRRTAAGAAAAAAQLLRQLNDVEDTLTRAEASAASEPPPPKVPAYRLAWRESQAYLAAGDGEAAVAAVLAANHDRTTARLLVALGDAQLSDATLDALLSEVASLLGGDYRAYALPYVAAAAKAGALNRVRATTRAELAAGLAAAAARGDGDAGGDADGAGSLDAGTTGAQHRDHAARLACPIPRVNDTAPQLRQALPGLPSWSSRSAVMALLNATQASLPSSTRHESRSCMSSGFQLAMLAPSSFAIISPATCRSLLPAGKSSAAAWHSLNAAWMSLAWRTTRDGAAARCSGANLCAIQPVGGCVEASPRPRD